MDRFTLPAGWQEFSDALLAAKLDEIAALAARVDLDAAGDDTVPSGLEIAESLADAKDAIDAERTGRAAAHAASEERRAAVMARLAPTTEPEPVVEPVVAAAEPAVEPEPVVALVLSEFAPAAAEPEPEPEPEPVAAVAPPAAREGLAVMSSQRRAGELPKTAADVTRNGLMRTVDGDPIGDLDQLSVDFTNLINRHRTPHAGDDRRIPVMSSSWEFGAREMLSGTDMELNFSVFNQVERDYAGQLEALVASGGPCAPLMPSYEFFECYSPQRHVEQGLPVVGAPRGGIRFLNPVPLGADSAAAIDHKTVAESALVPPAYTPKACTRVSCPSETSVTVEAFSWCVTFDNLNFRVFPEQVANMLRRVQIEFVKAKEIFYLNRLEQLANAPIDIAAAQPSPFGAARSLLRDLVMAGHNYRKRNNMSRDAMLDVWLPDVVEDILLVDMVNDADMGGMQSIVGGPTGNLSSTLAQRARLNVRWNYYDSTEVGFPASAHDGNATAWRPFPTEFRSYIYAPGSVVRLNGGSLDLGIVRDSTLNGTNDLQMFAEEWIQVARPGCEIAAFTHTACYSGVGPLGVAAPACP